MITIPYFAHLAGKNSNNFNLDGKTYAQCFYQCDSFGWVKLPLFQIIKGGRSNVQFTYHTLRQKDSCPFGRLSFCFLAEKERFSPPAPKLARRATAQITEQSRVGKLACQRGGEGCSVAARQRTSVRRSPKGAPRSCATWSRVQIIAQNLTIA